MKQALLLSTVLIFSGCSTTKVATDYFYNNIAPDYCMLGPITRNQVRESNNAGRDIKVFIQCPGEDICKAPGTL